MAVPAPAGVCSGPAASRDGAHAPVPGATLSAATYVILHEKLARECACCRPAEAGSGVTRNVIIVLLSVVMLGAVVVSLVLTMVLSVPPRGPAAPALAAPVITPDYARGKITIDMAELTRLGISTEDVIEHLRHIQDGYPYCPHAPGGGGGTAGGRVEREMRRHWLSNSTVTCSDGSPAGYYLRKSSDSSRWLVFLEGGWYCFDQHSCVGRWLNTPSLMGSARWPHKRMGTGILSTDPDDNPYAHDANLVYLPYCSQDSWSGTYKGKQGENMSEQEYQGAL